MEYQKETGEHRCGEGPLSPLSLMECAQAIKIIRRNTGYKSPKLYKSMNCHCQINSTQITFACMMGLPDRSLSTQYLDGLPGCAAVVVLVHHEPICGTTWNIDGFRNHEYTLQLPVLRLIYSGFQMLAIFFVLSVHVLSWLSGLPSGYPPLSPRLEVPCSRRRVQHSILGCILDCTARTISSSLAPRSNRLATCR